LKINVYIPEKASIKEIEADVERSFDMAAAAFLVGRHRNPGPGLLDPF
jgi:hypothetical protein